MTYLRYVHLKTSRFESMQGSGGVCVRRGLAQCLSSSAACLRRRCERSVSMRLYVAGQYGHSERCAVCEWKWCQRLDTSLPHDLQRHSAALSAAATNMLWYEYCGAGGSRARSATNPPPPSRLRDYDTSIRHADTTV